MKFFLIVHTLVWLAVMAAGCFALYAFSGNMPSEIRQWDFLAYSYIHTVLYSFPIYCILRVLKQEFDKRFKRI